MSKDKCEFCCEKEGQIYRCNNEQSGGITRTKSLCFSHFFILRRDNIRRNIKGLDIPYSFDMIIRTTKLIKTLCSNKVDKMPEFKIPEDEIEYEIPECIVEDENLEGIEIQELPQSL